MKVEIVPTTVLWEATIRADTGVVLAYRVFGGKNAHQDALAWAAHMEEIIRRDKWLPSPPDCATIMGRAAPG